SGKPESPPDPLEPLRLANVAAQMQLKHVVVTSVDRDDVPDRGAGHYAATIRALKAKVPQASIEVLTPDFLDVEEEALHTVPAEPAAREDRPLGAPRRVSPAPRAGRGARVRLGVRRSAGPLELPRRRAAPCGRDRPRRRRVLAEASYRMPVSIEKSSRLMRPA